MAEHAGLLKTLEPDVELHSDLLDSVGNRHQEIIHILQYCRGCDIQEFRVDGVFRAAGIPTLDIETDYAEEDTGRPGTRVRALR